MHDFEKWYFLQCHYYCSVGLGEKTICMGLLNLLMFRGFLYVNEACIAKICLLSAMYPRSLICRLRRTELTQIIYQKYILHKCPVFLGFWKELHLRLLGRLAFGAKLRRDAREASLLAEAGSALEAWDHGCSPAKAAQGARGKRNGGFCRFLFRFFGRSWLRNHSRHSIYYRHL